MDDVVVRQAGGGSPAAMEGVLREEGWAPFRWSNTPGYRYPPHHHDYDSVIVCVSGSITFQVAGNTMELHPGDRIDLPAGVEHAATVGPDGVECIEGTS